jgi:hypothetical protein
MEARLGQVEKRFDRLLKAMTQGEPHKAEKRAEKAAEKQSPAKGGD